jgi:hypothetical protein
MNFALFDKNQTAQQNDGCQRIDNADGVREIFCPFAQVQFVRKRKHKHDKNRHNYRKRVDKKH